MKVGILTFFRPINNGAVLQACATNSIVLPKMGVDSELIDYRIRRIEVDRKLFGIVRIMNEPDLIKRIRRIFADVARLPANYTQRNLYDKFIKKYLRISDQVYLSHEELIQKCQGYDAYIVGSDLVWSPLMAEGVNPTYFLDFVKGNVPKIAYAPSIGTTNLSGREFKDYKKNLIHLDYVSVREKSAADQLGPLTEKAITTVLDPTLLTIDSEWDNFYSKTPLIQEDYIFAISLEKSDKLIETVNQLAYQNNCIVVAFGRKNNKYKGRRVIFTESSCGPSEFLNLIKNAACVVSNSYHGCAFSIVFHKDFYCIPHSTRGIRMIDLLNSLGLEDRIVCENSDIKADLDNKRAINYILVERERNMLMDESYKYLQIALNK